MQGSEVTLATTFNPQSFLYYIILVPGNRLKYGWSSSIFCVATELVEQLP
jgi:hypothetical protein